MHVDYAKTEHLRALADSTEIIPEISVGSMSIHYETKANTIPATRQPMSSLLGDPLAEEAERLLSLHAPYPGDDLKKEESFSGQCFVIYRVSNTHHVIMDGARRQEEDMTIPSALLRNPRFPMGDWYTTHLAKRLGWSRSETRQRHNGEPMGDPTSRRVSEILNKERDIPNIESRTHFKCERVTFNDEAMFEIMDRDLIFRIWASQADLANAKLDVSRWYARRLEKAYQQMHTMLLERELESEYYQFRALENEALSPLDCALEEVAHQLFAIPNIRFAETRDQFRLVELNGQQVAPGTYPAIQRNSATTRDFKCLIPKPIVIVVHINGRPA